MKWVLVAFKHDEENSIHYKKGLAYDQLFREISKAIEKGATFASLRFIKEDFEKHG